MKTFLAALLMLPLASGAALAQAGNAGAGKTLWEGNTTACKNCHGEQGQGAFGPDLAGRGLSVEQFKVAVQKPWGIMPAFPQYSDAQLADLAAYFGGLPKPAQPGPWRFQAAAGAPPGQQAIINVGCAQCHGPTFNGPRGNLGAVNADFEYFANLVYNHTTALPPHRALLGANPNGNIAMGNYDRFRVNEATLRQIYFWARDEIGFRVPLQGRIAANGTTYTVNVANNGLQGKGLTAEGVTVKVLIPEGVTVVSATGEGYKGVHMDAQAKSNVAEWQVPRMAPKDAQAYTVTLSKPAEGLKGEIRWAKPAPKTGPSADVVAFAAGGAG